MSQYGGHNPGGGAPYPSAGGTPYPAAGQGGAFPQLQKPGQTAGHGQAPYPNQAPANASGQAKVPPPRPAPPAPHGGGHAPYPGQGQGQTPYPGQGQSPYPGQGQSPYPGQGQGQTPYPGQGQTPYPGQGQTPYPGQGQGQTPNPGQGQGQTPNPGQGQGQTPYPGQGQGQTPYPGQGQGQTPYPGQGQTPYPGQGQTPHPGQGQTPHPGQGQTPHAGQAHGQAPYPGQGQAPYPGQGQAPYPGQGQAPYPSQGQKPHAGQGHGQAPYPGQGQAPYPGQGQTPYPGQGQAPHPGHGQVPPPGQGHTAPYQTQGQGSYPGQGQVPSYGQQGHPGPQTQGPTGHVPKYGVDEYKSKVEIRIECRNLLNKDVMSKSDPCAAMYMMRGGRWEEVGRTENIKNCLDPKFARAFTVNYFFEEVQKVLIAVYDLDNSTPELTDDDFLGQIETTLGQLVSNTPMTTSLVLRNGRKAGQGTITLRTEEIKKGGEKVMMTFRAQKLDKKDLFGKSDPYLEILRATTDGSWQTVHRTEVIKNNLNPSWRPFEVSLQTMCGGNTQQQIKFECYDWDSDGSHDFIGGFTTTVEEMMKAGQQERSWPVINQHKKAKKKSYNNSGMVYLTSCKVVKEYSFLDFITSGTQINFTVGIDFTASNGNPSQSSSLHYINPYQPNEYMAAIKAVGDVCQDYDFDKMFPALGFGAKIPPAMQVSHEFAINFNPQNPYCQGIDGILQAYNNCIRHVQLYGPTNATPIINHVAGFAMAAQKEEMQKGAHAYFILLMLTDGVLSDMSNTKHAVVQASKLPMSIIIVGVGNADFADMEELDGDVKGLRSPNGELAKRDIVQFVPFREFRHSTSVELARHVLAEVPKQVTDYYKMRQMAPNKKPA